MKYLYPPLRMNRMGTLWGLRCRKNKISVPVFQSAAESIFWFNSFAKWTPKFGVRYICHVTIRLIHRKTLNKRMISLEIRYFNQAWSHVSVSPQRPCLKIRTNKCCPVLFFPRWISTSDFIPSPVCKDLNPCLKVTSFRNVQQQKNTPKTLMGWHFTQTSPSEP